MHAASPELQSGAIVCNAPLAALAETNVTNSQLEARHIVARPEGPGLGFVFVFSPERATRRLPRPYRAMIQCAGDSRSHNSRAFSPGYHMTGFQPVILVLHDRLRAAMHGFLAAVGVLHAQGEKNCRVLSKTDARLLPLKESVENAMSRTRTFNVPSGSRVLLSSPDYCRRGSIPQIVIRVSNSSPLTIPAEPMLEEILARSWNELMSRSSGPLHFRLVIQPLIATVLAIRAGWADAREGRPIFFSTLVREPAQRRVVLKNLWKLVGKVFLVAVVLDVVYQLIVLHWVHPVVA